MRWKDVGRRTSDLLKVIYHPIHEESFQLIQISI